MDDHELLREYVEHHSERAFSDLVRRHLPFVYGTALRLVRDAAAAEDVAQSVFIDLARKAWTVRPGTLPGWLYRATQRSAYMAIRTENRRRQRETDAMNLDEQNRDPTAIWENLAPLLDGALRQLNRVEQDALLLRYFDGQSMSETGRLLSLSEPAAQMRISRALEKMRTYFARQGVTASAALLASALGTQAASPPPVGLASKITPPALAGAAGQAGGTGIFYLLLKILYMGTKTKTTVTVATVAVLLAFIAGGLWWETQPAPVLVKVASAPASSTSPIDPISTAANAKPSVPMVATPTQPQSPLPSDSAIPPSAPTADLQAELKSVVMDMASVIRTSSTIGLMKTYMMPNDLSKINPQEVRQAQTQTNRAQRNPQIQQMMQQMDEELAQAFDALKDQIPTMNATGDEATYLLPPNSVVSAKGSPGAPMPIVLIKINGKWYIKKMG